MYGNQWHVKPSNSQFSLVLRIMLIGKNSANHITSAFSFNYPPTPKNTQLSRAKCLKLIPNSQYGTSNMTFEIYIHFKFVIPQIIMPFKILIHDLPISKTLLFLKVTTLSPKLNSK
uniref:Uncharacterized protein n=1 Tax=Micrurus surinamensis TaxID=129470 RepID=A0A2D4PFA6_MICSU